MTTGYSLKADSKYLVSDQRNKDNLWHLLPPAINIFLCSTEPIQERTGWANTSVRFFGFRSLASWNYWAPLSSLASKITWSPELDWTIAHVTDESSREKERRIDPQEIAIFISSIGDFDATRWFPFELILKVKANYQRSTCNKRCLVTS